MRWTAGLIFLLATAASAPAIADPDEGDTDTDPGPSSGGGGGRSHGPFGVGVILGEPTALSAKLMLNDANGVQAHLGYGIGRRGRLIFIVDYLFHIPSVIPPIPPGRMTPYVGVGGRLGVGENAHGNRAVLGVRFPVGLSLFLKAAPLEIFAEIALGIGLLPETDLLIDGGLGARFYF